jgi:hypothetical protein
MEGRGGSGMRENPLAFVSKGMKVYDLNGEEIGTVERVYVSQIQPDEAREPEPNRSDEPDMAREGLWDVFEEVFDPVDELEEDMRVELWRSGFIRLDAPGLTGEKRYISPYRISDVSDEGVRLAVSYDELVRG